MHTKRFATGRWTGGSGGDIRSDSTGCCEGARPLLLAGCVPGPRASLHKNCHVHLTSLDGLGLVSVSTGLAGGVLGAANRGRARGCAALY